VTPRAAPDRPGESGFTLLEILIGLAISALIMVGLSSAMRVVNMGWEQATDFGERQAMLKSGLRVFGGDIGHAERVFDDPAKPQAFLFAGTSSVMAFPMVERAGHNIKGLYWIRYEVRRAPEGVELVRWRAPFVLGRQDLAAIEWRDAVVLVHGPFDISFSYLSSAPSATSWSESWSMQNRLPRQVRLDIEGHGRTALVLPPYIATLRNSAELTCVRQDSNLCTLANGGTLPTPAEGQQ
jgi:general secretion pathway protein J